MNVATQWKRFVARWRPRPITDADRSTIFDLGSRCPDGTRPGLEEIWEAADARGASRDAVRAFFNPTEPNE
jgi:hypothetical protein